MRRTAAVGEETGDRGGEVNGTCQDTVIHVMFTEIKYLKLNDSERATEWTEE